MNITGIFFNNGQLNWDAISTTSNIILVGFLVFVTYRYANQIKKQTEFMKIDRVVKEMDNLVAPLYSKLDDFYIFEKDIPRGLRDVPSAIDEYNRFWEEVKKYKYLGPDYLRSAIDNYLKKDDSFKKAKDELIKAINQRYSELENELSILRNKS